MNVLLVDDHAVVRLGLKQLVHEAYPYVKLTEAGTACEAHSLMDKVRWDLIMLDINLPDHSGVELLKTMKSEYPSIPVIVLSLHPEEQYALRALKAGASAYLTKERAPDELVSAIKHVLTGRKFITATLAERLAAATFAQSAIMPHEQLTDREFEVLRGIGRGKTVSRIAQDMGLSIKTISTYRTRLLGKMGLTTTSELIRYSIDHALV